jgi:hypothetical protein
MDNAMRILRISGGTTVHRLAILNMWAICALVVTQCLWPPAVWAVSPWGDPVVLFSAEHGSVMQSVLIADGAGDVHLFFPHSNEVAERDSATKGTMYYMRLHEGRWSAPADVHVSARTAIDEPAAILDDKGYLHLIWKEAGHLAYSRAHVDLASRAQAWTKPVELSDAFLSNGAFGKAADITRTDNGSIHILFGTMAGQLLYRRSDDEGLSWSQPVTLVDARGSEPARPDLPQIIGDGEGRLHAAWTSYAAPAGWPPRGAFSARSLDNGATWSEPIRLIGDNYGLVSMASSGKDVIHRVWNSVSHVKERRHQWSPDGGDTWSRSVNSITPGLSGGLTGFPGLAVDSSGVLHAITAAEGPEDRGSKGGIYHLVFRADHWTTPTHISRGSVGRTSVEQPSVTISEGNRLHVVWEDDFRRLWYASTLVDAPTTPRQAVFRPPELLRRTHPDENPSLKAALEEPRPVSNVIATSLDVNASGSPGPALFAGGVATLIVIAIAVIGRCLHPGKGLENYSKGRK